MPFCAFATASYDCKIRNFTGFVADSFLYQLLTFEFHFHNCIIWSYHWDSYPGNAVCADVHTDGAPYLVIL